MQTNFIDCRMTQIKTNHSLESNIFQTRKSKFLFDSIFRIGTGISNAFGDDANEETDYHDVNIEKCDCGK